MPSEVETLISVDRKGLPLQAVVNLIPDIRWKSGLARIILVGIDRALAGILFIITNVWGLVQLCKGMLQLLVAQGPVVGEHLLHWHIAKAVQGPVELLEGRLLAGPDDEENKAVARGKNGHAALAFNILIKQQEFFLIKSLAILPQNFVKIIKFLWHMWVIEGLKDSWPSGFSFVYTSNEGWVLAKLYFVRIFLLFFLLNFSLS